jgi:shikimate dehydrogenase
MNSQRPVKLAVFGQPVAHSQSPRIHRLFGEQLGIGVDYAAIESGVDELPERLNAFRDAGGTGANLTVPLKQAGLRLCTRVDRAARQAHAVNTLALADDGWHGFNTDGEGLMRDLERLALSPAGRRVLVLGAGGAVAGLLGPLLDRRPAAVCLLNRSLERAERLADKFAHLGPIHARSLDAAEEVAGYDLLIQSTSAGHGGSLPTLSPDWLAPDAVAYDLNYGPAHAPFRQWCLAAGFRVHSGLGMLVAQAALAFEIWTARAPDAGPVLAELEDG